MSTQNTITDTEQYKSSYKSYCSTLTKYIDFYTPKFSSFFYHPLLYLSM